jgi:hypothetical protein
MMHLQLMKQPTKEAKAVRKRQCLHATSLTCCMASRSRPASFQKAKGTCAMATYVTRKTQPTEHTEIRGDITKEVNKQHISPAASPVAPAPPHVL